MSVVPAVWRGYHPQSRDYPVCRPTTTPILSGVTVSKSGRVDDTKLEVLFQGSYESKMSTPLVPAPRNTTHAPVCHP